MKGFIEGDDREQGVLFPDHLEDFVGEDNPVRSVDAFVDAFVDALDLVDIGFRDAAATGRPGYHSAVLLKIYVCGYLSRIQSSCRLELETGRTAAPSHRRDDVGERSPCAKLQNDCGLPAR